MILIDLIVPSVICWLISSFIIFDLNLNFLAEITYSKNRTFYLDWWNSTTFSQFWRRWNKPVHHFLHNHVYLTLYFINKIFLKFIRIENKFSRESSVFWTFFVSGCIHEIAMIIIFKSFKFYFLAIFIFQLVRKIELVYLTDEFFSLKASNYNYREIQE